MDATATKNRFGVHLEEREDDSSASGIVFGHGWSALNTKHPAHSSPYTGFLNEPRMLFSTIPPRPKPPAAWLTNNDHQASHRHEEEEEDKTAVAKSGRPSTSSTVNTVAVTKPLLNAGNGTSSKVHEPLLTIRRTQSLDLLVSKLSACAISCTSKPTLAAQACIGQPSSSGDLQSFSCFSINSRNQQKSSSIAGFTDVMPKFWVDKHRPESLSSFVINTQQAQHLKQLISRGNCHNLLIRGPLGSGKKCLIMALLADIFGTAVFQVRNETRTFVADGKKFSLPMASSGHHIEINLGHVGVYLRTVLTTIFKEMKVSCKTHDNDFDASNLMDYKVLVLYEADKVNMESQQYIRWLMDCYTDHCKVIFCCQNTLNILESIQSRCVVVDVKPPTVEDVVQVLQFVAKRENIELPLSFARRIATLSESNLRQAVLSLEACKVNQYPFKQDQPIVTDWEDEIINIARDITNEQTPKRLYHVKGKIQRLLDEGLAAKIIHWRLVDELVRLVDVPLKDEIHQWAKFYAKKLPEGADAVFKLEEFVAKLMSIYKKFTIQYKDMD